MPLLLGLFVKVKCHFAHFGIGIVMQNSPDLFGDCPFQFDNVVSNTLLLNKESIICKITKFLNKIQIPQRVFFWLCDPEWVPPISWASQLGSGHFWYHKEGDCWTKEMWEYKDYRNKIHVNSERILRGWASFCWLSPWSFPFRLSIMCIGRWSDTIKEMINVSTYYITN